METIKIETIEDLEKVENIISKIQGLGNGIKRSSGSKAFKDFADGMKKIYDEIEPSYFEKQFGEKIYISELLQESFNLAKNLKDAINNFNEEITGISNEYSER